MTQVIDTRYGQTHREIITKASEKISIAKIIPEYVKYEKLYKIDYDGSMFTVKCHKWSVNLWSTVYIIVLRDFLLQNIIF